MVKTRAKPLPRWAVLLGSIAVAFHLFLLLIHVIAAESGPWLTQDGPTPAGPPYFAALINSRMYKYFQTLHLTHNYHFASNQTDTPAVVFEVKLKDRKGKELETVKFPQEKANFWVRHRQSMLAKSLGDDQPVQAPRTNAQPPRLFTIWNGEATLKVEEVPDYKMSRDRPLFRPSKWSMLLAKSYARYAARTYASRYDDAVSIEVIRRSRNPIRPEALVAGEAVGMLDEMVSSFGEFPTDEK
jgi:hypothetical protein